eukprot:2148355-Amphidinium_carterae.1
MHVESRLRHGSSTGEWPILGYNRSATIAKIRTRKRPSSSSHCKASMISATCCPRRRFSSKDIVRGPHEGLSLEGTGSTTRSRESCSGALGLTHVSRDTHLSEVLLGLE